VITAKPLVLADNLHLQFNISKDSRKNGFLGADGQVYMEITQDMEVIVKGSDLYVPCKEIEIFLYFSFALR
jgi:NAD kinase